MEFEGIYIEKLKCPICESSENIIYRHAGPHIRGECLLCGQFSDNAKQLNDERWKELIKKRAGYVCERCGEILDPAHARAHHLLPVWFMPELSLDPANGICLCTKCHKQIHGAGGTIRNEQP